MEPALEGGTGGSLEQTSVEYVAVPSISSASQSMIAEASSRRGTKNLTDAAYWSKVDQRSRMSCPCVPSFLWSVVLAATTGSVLFGINTAVLNTSADYIASELKWCGSEGYVGCDKAMWYKTFVSTAVFAGAAVGALSSGKFTEKMGLQRTYTHVALPIFALSIIGSACANSFVSLLWNRLVVGFAVGIASALTPNYIAEIAPSAKRGKCGVAHQLLVVLGQLVAMLLGLAFTTVPTADDDESEPTKEQQRWKAPVKNKVWWRFMLAVPIIPTLLGMIYFLYVYTFDTPCGLVHQKQDAQARALLQRLSGTDEVTEELREIRKSDAMAQEMAKKQIPFGQLLQQPGYGKALAVGVGLAIFQQITGINAFVANSNRLFQDAGLSATAATYASIGITCINALCTFIPLFILDKLGRKTLLFWGAIGMTLATAPATVCYWVEWNKDKSSTAGMALAILGACLFMFFFAVSVGPITWVYIVEVFPLDMKAVGSAICIAANWLASIVMVFSAGFLPAKVAYTIFTIASALFVVFVALCVRETKGRSLGDSPFVNSETALQAAPSGLPEPSPPLAP
ncbi:sugar transporter [Gregarina niphandrodes]|uniref:Hexose transporter 1 n=1 Tax=Gregarina niphandrodes TaxID=110365 RepID=A0A023B2C0_GRENI|nr:sugar transporter [Gregarina niphandrodes]EZG51585.1 sugar transporter [Gregarina niphandrodes]|eukprot:XP_011131945.1 sugar transporter [Gregarina niphandrodes]